MSNIHIARLTFKYDDSSTNIFNNLNLNLDSTWKLGLVGRNGRGKTTFLNLLRGKLKGRGQIQTTVAFSYFPVAIQDENNLVFYELQKQAVFEQWELERELNLMGADSNLLWQPFKTLSGGEQTKILLALSFTKRGFFPLIDEPTNHLDEASRLQIAHYLQGHKRGYIVVSHDRAFLNQVSDHILAIENTEIHLYQGSYNSYEKTKKRRDDFNTAKNKKLKEDIYQLNQSRERLKTYSAKAENNKKAKAGNDLHQFIDKGFMGHKAAKIMQRSKNVERRMNRSIAEKRGLMSNIEKIPPLSINFNTDYHQNLLVVRHFGLEFSNGKNLFCDLNFVIRQQGIIALRGKNGSGKTTFLKYLLGQKEGLKTRGKCDLSPSLKISYLPQNFSQYKGTLKEFATEEKISYEALLNNLKKLGLPRASFSLPIEEMSKGQQKRVALAKSLVEPANLYLWDEPANYLDVFNQDQLVSLLKKKQPAMLLVEHDRYFIDQVAAEKVALTPFH